MQVTLLIDGEKNWFFCGHCIGATAQFATYYVSAKAKVFSTILPFLQIFFCFSQDFIALKISLQVLKSSSFCGGMNQSKELYLCEPAHQFWNSIDVLLFFFFCSPSCSIPHAHLYHRFSLLSLLQLRCHYDDISHLIISRLSFLSPRSLSFVGFFFFIKGSCK